MGGRGRGRQLPKIKCRVCESVINKQSYPDHLKGHPGADPKDRREFGQSTIFDVAQKKRKAESIVHDDKKEDEESVIDDVDDSQGLDFTLDEGETGESLEEGEEEADNVRVAGLGEDELDSLQKLLSTESLTVPVSEVNKKLDDIISNTDIDVDFTGCSTELDEMNKRLEAIRKIVNIMEDVKQLTNSLQDLKLVDENKTKTKNETVDTDSVLKDVRSLKEITDKIPELSYNLEKGFLECNVCLEKFKYGSEQKDDFTGENMGIKFRSLKRSLRRHMKTAKHMMTKKSMMAKDQQQRREESRNQAVGMRISRIIYYLCYNARSDADFTLLIYLMNRAGVMLVT